MKKIISVVALSLLAYSSATAETLSIEDQTRIITGYGVATGQIQSAPSAQDDPSRPPDKCGTSVINEFRESRDRLDPALLSALGVQLLPRPVGLPLAYGSPAGRFLVHYVDTGLNAVYQPQVRTLEDTVPDYVVMIARIADSVYTHIIDTLGYPIPPVDGFYPTGIDDRFDIYLSNLGAQFYGLTYIDSVIPFTTTATSYLVLDNDYQSIDKYVNRPLDAARVTVAHEYFHAVQFGMDFTEYDGYPAATRRQYWMEMSAVWMEEECYDAINDYYAYLPYFLDDPTISLQAFGGTYNLHQYGASLFPIFLSQRYGKNIIRDIWVGCAAGGTGPQFLTVCDAAVRAVDPPDGNLATAINEFSVWNYFTGQYGSVAPTVMDPLWDKTPHVFGYEEREAYPAIPIGSILTVSRYPGSYQIDVGPYRPEYNGTGYLLLQNLGTRNACYGVDTSASPDTLMAIPCDSVLPIYIGVQHPNLIEWGISIIYQLADYPDSMEINRFVVPLGGSPVPVFVEVDAFHPNRYRSIAIAVSPTSNNYLNYALFNAPGVGYAISTLDSGVIITRPSAALTPYPNPAVVNSMAGQPLTFRFQVASDTTNSNVTDNPLLLIDIYTVAGEFVKTINATFGGEDRLGVHSAGIYETGWDMKNGAGKGVASGVYLAYARLWDTPEKKKLLAESKSKVALIR